MDGETDRQMDKQNYPYKLLHYNKRHNKSCQKTTTLAER